MVTRTPLLLLACAAFAVACADTGVGVTATPPDAAVDVAPDVTLDVASDTALDAPVDVPVDNGPPRCFANGDCAGNPAGAVCDAVTGRCVQCLAVADTCPAAQHCDAASNTCVAGCSADEGCASAADAGATRTHCDTAARACVECVTNDHCAAGTLCVGNTCVPGCSAGSACPTSQTCCGGACVDTRSNTAHCGVCDTRCMAPNATAACMNGACAIGACAAPFGDCDMNPANGCEANTLSDVMHCGGCGMACAARPNTAASCAAGRCAYACAAGFADCDGDAANGCEVDTRDSLAHCGACGRVCSLPNATAACVMGACTVGVCAGSFGNCDGNASNGCETDTRASASHCGACGNACPSRDNALTACASGRCVIACLAGYADCDGNEANGCEVDTRTALAHCGGCGRLCAPTNASGVCAMGACGVARCTAPFGDCDMNPLNGCETDTRASAAHCGACGNACPARPRASPTCAGATCGITCDAGYGDCDGDASNGCETDLSTSATHCGRCGNACASRVCAGGACQAPSCTDGVQNGGESDVDCGGSSSCARCELCRTCAVNADCGAGTCSAAGRCTFRTEVYTDWVNNCRGTGGGRVDNVVAGVPAGNYTVTALPSGASVWNPVSYPSTGWFWYITCENLAAPALRTPAGMLYPTADAAFAALPTTSTTASFAGGTLRCYFTDEPCSDNQGGIRFRIERTCP